VNFPCVRCASVVRDVRLGTPLRREAAVLRRRSPELAGPDASWPSRAEARLVGVTKSARPAAGVLLVGEGAASVGSRSRRGTSDYLLSVCPTSSIVWLYVPSPAGVWEVFRPYCLLLNRSSHANLKYRLDL
jgi:hypothetical protein